LRGTSLTISLDTAAKGGRDRDVGNETRGEAGNGTGLQRGFFKQDFTDVVGDIPVNALAASLSLDRASQRVRSAAADLKSPAVGSWTLGIIAARKGGNVEISVGDATFETKFFICPTACSASSSS